MIKYILEFEYCFCDKKEPSCLFDKKQDAVNFGLKKISSVNIPAIFTIRTSKIKKAPTINKNAVIIEDIDINIYYIGCIINLTQAFEKSNPEQYKLLYELDTTDFVLQKDDIISPLFKNSFVYNKKLEKIWPPLPQKNK